MTKGKKKIFFCTPSNITLFYVNLEIKKNFKQAILPSPAQLESYLCYALDSKSWMQTAVWLWSNCQKPLNFAIQQSEKEMSKAISDLEIPKKQD